MFKKCLEGGNTAISTKAFEFFDYCLKLVFLVAGTGLAMECYQLPIKGIPHHLDTDSTYLSWVGGEGESGWAMGRGVTECPNFLVKDEKSFNDNGIMGVILC